MKRKTLLLILLVILLGAVAGGGIFYYRNLRGIGPALKKPPQDIAEVINTTGMPLSLPGGFSIEIFARDLPEARVMKFDSFGNMWVSQMREGKIALLEIQDGKVVRNNTIFQGLNKPHGLAFDPDIPLTLYFAEETKVSRVPTYSDAGPEKILDLPGGGGHSSRTIGFGPDGRLYVSIGSSCNVCEESDERRAAIWSARPDGSDFKEFARGLRNSVFFIWRGIDIWATEMGRDLLGDDIPPDEINIVKAGRDYGWPYCYGKKVVDPFGGSASRCAGTEASHIDIQAHSAPLGLAFVPEKGWPKDWAGDLLVAYHGSWNRSVPTGYKIVRMKLDTNGNYEGVEDFITGWFQGNESSGALGRPVDLVFDNDGVLFISDDKAGVIYKVSYNKS